MSITFNLVAPSDIPTIQAQSGNQYSANSSGLVTGVVRQDLKDLINAGFLVVGFSNEQTVFGSSAGNFTEAGMLYKYQSVAGVGNTNDTTEDTLLSFSLPANSLDIPGRTLLVTASGTLAANAHSKTAKLYFGSSVVATTGAQTGSGVAWQLQIQLQKTASNVQLGFYCPIVGTTHGGIISANGTETDTAAITIKATGQTGTAAASDVLLNSLLVEAYN